MTIFICIINIIYNEMLRKTLKTRS